MKRCPKCGGEEFLVTQHVAQTISVDGNGNFLKEISSCDEVTHRANDENCNYNAAGSEFNSPNIEE